MWNYIEYWWWLPRVSYLNDQIVISSFFKRANSRITAAAKQDHLNFLPPINRGSQLFSQAASESRDSNQERCASVEVLRDCTLRTNQNPIGGSLRLSKSSGLAG
jgi:hypothetical protein